MLVDEADAVVLLTGECWAKAEIDRVRGALLVRTGELEQAEKHLRLALKTARAQDAASWIDRTAVDLADLLRQTHRADEARRILSYGVAEW